MTKRDFDKATQENWGGPYMASDERAGYRAERGHMSLKGDWLAYRRARVRSGLAVLDKGSGFRSVARYRRDNGLPMLGQP